MALRSMRVWRLIDEVARAGSVRQAAERSNITASALLRRIQDVEYDLGAPLFERHASGMRLTAAGELLVRWVRSQNADLRRVRSQIEELLGLQRGEISLACSQATQAFVAEQSKEFLKRSPGIKFNLNVTDHRAAVKALSDFHADLAVIFQPFDSSDVAVLASAKQQLVAVMAHDHPLASKKTVQLKECGQYGVILSDRVLGNREILEDLLKASAGQVRVAYESNSFSLLPNLIVGTELLGFNIEIGTVEWRRDRRLALRPIVDAQRTNRPVIVGQLKGRTLPVAAAKFAEQLKKALSEIKQKAGKPAPRR